MHTVHVRVNDSATGKPTPVRLRLLDAQGNYHAPFGRLAEFALAPGAAVGGNVSLGGAAFAYIDGSCEVRLPAGEIAVEVHKGPEYVPLRRRLMLAPGQMSLRLAVQRWTDLRPLGWYAGDSRCHDLTPHAAQLEGAAEGLAVVNLLAREHRPSSGRPGAFSNLLAFSGTSPASSPKTSGECLVAVNTLNSHPVLGTVALLNCHRVVYPLSFGGPGGLDDWSVADWCGQCHRKKGLVVWPDLPRLTPEHLQGEALAALVLGKVDAFEVSDLDREQTFEDWYRLLAAGFRVGLVGGSGKDSNATALGGVRTYARLGPGEPLEYGAWIEAVRAGRTFITRGPLLSLEVEGQGPGAVVEVPAHGTVRVRAEARGAAPFGRLEVLAGGAVVASVEPSGEPAAALVEMDLRNPEGGWVAARCRGPGAEVEAHSGAVYLRGGGQSPRLDAAALVSLAEILERTREWVRGTARCESLKQREHLVEVLEAARQELGRRQEG